MNFQISRWRKTKQLAFINRAEALKNQCMQLGRDIEELNMNMN